MRVVTLAFVLLLGCFSQTGTVRDAVQVLVEGQGKVQFLNAECTQLCRFYHERRGTGTFGVDHIHIFTAHPAPGWRFERWEVDCGGTSTQIRVSIFRDMLCRAIFVAEKRK